MATLFSKKFGLPCKLTNDANAAATGEMKFGVAKNKKHFIVITLGTGVGSGIVIDGKLVVGHDGFAGELGHTIIRHNGRLHKGTGLKGTLESYASSGGVVETAVELLKESPSQESVLRAHDPKDITSKLIYEAAKSGDKIAIQVFNVTGQILGESFANFVHFSSPEAIILFGGLSNAADLLIQPIKHHIQQVKDLFMMAQVFHHKQIHQQL
jgi:glucokinase